MLELPQGRRLCVRLVVRCARTRRGPRTRPSGRRTGVSGTIGRPISTATQTLAGEREHRRHAIGGIHRRAGAIDEAHRAAFIELVKDPDPSPAVTGVRLQARMSLTVESAARPGRSPPSRMRTAGRPPPQRPRSRRHGEDGSQRSPSATTSMRRTRHRGRPRNGEVLDLLSTHREDGGRRRRGAPRPRDRARRSREIPRSARCA